MRPTTDMRPSLSSGTRHPEQEVAHFSISTQRWPTFRLARPAAGPFDTFDRSNYLDKNASVATISVGSLVPFSLDKHKRVKGAREAAGTPAQTGQIGAQLRVIGRDAVSLALAGRHRMPSWIVDQRLIRRKG